MTADDCPFFVPPRATGRPFDPPPELIERLNHPIGRVRIWDGSTPWLICRYADVRQALAEDESLSIDPRRVGFPEKTATRSATIGRDRNLRTMDNPEHAVQKRLLVREFTVKAIESLSPVVKAIVDEAVDRFAAKPPPQDLYTGLTFDIPTRVMSHLLGIDVGDREYFENLSARCRSDNPDEAAAAVAELHDYLAGVIRRKLNNGDDDLTTRLASIQASDGLMNYDELVDLIRLLLLAGHATTAQMMTLGLLVLLQHPKQLAELRSSNDPRLINNAIEELLRYVGIAHSGRRRVATTELHVGGHVIRVGEGVIMANNVADRDPRTFTRPDVFDIHRKDANKHMAFGFGMHQCIGQHLARLELRIALPAILRNFPALRLAVSLESLEFIANRELYEARGVLVTW